MPSAQRKRSDRRWRFGLGLGLAFFALALAAGWLMGRADFLTL